MSISRWSIRFTRETKVGEQKNFRSFSPSATLRRALLLLLSLVLCLLSNHFPLCLSIVHRTRSLTSGHKYSKARLLSYSFSWRSHVCSTRRASTRNWRRRQERNLRRHRRRQWCNTRSNEERRTSAICLCTRVEKTTQRSFSPSHISMCTDFDEQTNPMWDGTKCLLRISSSSAYLSSRRSEDEGKVWRRLSICLANACVCVFSLLDID